MIEDLHYLNNVTQHINNNEEKGILSIIYNSDYINDINIDLSKNVIPVLFSDNHTITNLKLYDIRKENLNYYVNIICKLILYLDSVKLTELVLTILFYTNLVITFVI